MKRILFFSPRKTGFVDSGDNALKYFHLHKRDTI
jgi:hypothetical protein